MALTREERETFLKEPHIAAFAVDAGAGRAPLTVPIWYQYEPDGTVWILIQADSRKNQLLSAAGRFTLMVQRTEPTIRYVSVEGPVTRTAAASGELSREMAARYLPPDKVDGYLEYERTQLGEHVPIYMRPEHWLSSDLGTV